MIKKLVLAALVAGISVASVNAQDVPTRTNEGVQKTHKARKPGEGGMNRLDLTDQQKTELKSLNQDFRKQLTELQKEDQITVKESRERRKSLAAAHQEKVSAILTPEQREKMQKMKEQRKTRTHKKTGPAATNK